MSVGILLISHNRIGAELLATARETLGFCPVRTRTLEITQDDDPVARTRKAMELCRLLDDGDGVLVLTDACGSTPSNIAARLVRDQPVTVIAGLNLPMLLRVFNYPGLDRRALAAVALAGGTDGVVEVTSYPGEGEF